MNIRTTLYIMTALLAVSCGRKTGDGPTVSRFDGFTQGTTYHILVKSDGPLHMENEIDSLLTEVDNSTWYPHKRRFREIYPLSYGLGRCEI